MELPELISEWVRYSRTDVDIAKQLNENMHPRPLEAICYHAQQSAEKALKAFLIQCDIVPPKTHDLNRLCEICKQNDGDFIRIAPLCGTLNRYSNMPRYPFEIEVFESDAEAAIRNADAIYKWTIEKLSESLPQESSS